MATQDSTGHPWMGNSLADTKRAMLDEIGAASIAELFEQIPEDHRMTGALNLPLGIKSEAALRRHLTDKSPAERHRSGDSVAG